MYKVLVSVFRKIHSETDLLCCIHVRYSHWEWSKYTRIIPFRCPASLSLPWILFRKPLKHIWLRMGLIYIYIFDDYRWYDNNHACGHYNNFCTVYIWRIHQWQVVLGWQGDNRTDRAYRLKGLEGHLTTKVSCSNSHRLFFLLWKAHDHFLSIRNKQQTIKFRTYFSIQSCKCIECYFHPSVLCISVGMPEKSGDCHYDNRLNV